MACKRYVHTLPRSEGFVGLQSPCGYCLSDGVIYGIATIFRTGEVLGMMAFEGWELLQSREFI